MVDWFIKFNSVHFIPVLCFLFLFSLFRFLYHGKLSSFPLSCCARIWSVLEIKSSMSENGGSMGTSGMNEVIGDEISFLMGGSFEHGHLVWRCFERFRCLFRKWNGFLHFDDTMSSSISCLFLFFFLRFFAVMSFQKREAIFCL